jgi:ribonuclease HI
MGIGAVILRGGMREEISEYIGQGTNNIAELTAHRARARRHRRRRRLRPVLVHVDSAYAIGVASGAFKAKKNVELVARLRDKTRRFPHLRFIKVAGHAGVPENERCDQLATQAIARGGGRRLGSPRDESLAPWVASPFASPPGWEFWSYARRASSRRPSGARAPAPADPAAPAAPSAPPRPAPAAPAADYLGVIVADQAVDVAAPTSTDVSPTC